ncbi:hypothetical protein HU200_063174 [Digitaria exilis]|uniref:At1g61320/AtMIF1 LRR domain-containing protein n=1 Tax=Digitaria exilis TaxID=1010633 RepID=A0A835DZS6_9POAL|nr:hypothetical protein HU200_063174 [Digitaria exilis]
MPLRDAARAACVSRTFLCFWRCYPKLTFTKKTLGLKRNGRKRADITRDFTSIVDSILKNHSANTYCNANYINSWLQIAITPGIEEVSLLLPSYYNFPCSLLFDGRTNSIRVLYLTDCAFRPMVSTDCLRSLTKLDLCEVRITGDELGCLLSSSFALERLGLRYCNELICLKIPFYLGRLSFLMVFECQMLQIIESKAPNLFTFRFSGDPVQLSLGDLSHLKLLNVGFSSKISSCTYAVTKLPSIVPHLKTLIVSSFSERGSNPIVGNKFIHLKYLEINLGPSCGAFSPDYDYFCLVSFLDVSPVLETFIVHQGAMKHYSIFTSSLCMRNMPEHKHDMLKNVMIIGFCSAKSMVELTCHILENVSSLEYLTVDTVYDEEDDDRIGRCSVRKTGRCGPVTRHMILEAHKALEAIRRYLAKFLPRLSSMFGNLAAGAILL